MRGPRPEGTVAHGPKVTRSRGPLPGAEGIAGKTAEELDVADHLLEIGLRVERQAEVLEEGASCASELEALLSCDRFVACEGPFPQALRPSHGHHLAV